jgi:hypothetical protein
VSGAVVRWGPPPERKNAIFSAEIMAELQGRPGEWALIRHYDSHVHFRVKVPAGFQALWHQEGARPNRTSGLYARAVPTAEGAEVREASWG